MCVLLHGVYSQGYGFMLTTAVIGMQYSVLKLGDKRYNNSKCAKKKPHKYFGCIVHKSDDATTYNFS